MSKPFTFSSQERKKERKKERERKEGRKKERTKNLPHLLCLLFRGDRLQPYALKNMIKIVNAAIITKNIFSSFYLASFCFHFHWLPPSNQEIFSVKMEGKIFNY